MNMVVDKPLVYSKDREVINADAIQWLKSISSLKGSILCGLPDISELLTLLPGTDLKCKCPFYKEWFVSTVELILEKLEEGEYSIFYQTDSKISNSDGTIVEWIDKAFLCNSVAQRLNCTLCWHKISNNFEDGVLSNRPSYSHLLCFVKGKPTYHTTSFVIPDIIDRGFMHWPNAMGLEACIHMT
jgi:hypothetical protein